MFWFLSALLRIKCLIYSVCCLYLSLTTGLAYVKRHIEHMTHEDEEEHVGHSTDEDDFFSSLKSKKSKGTSELDGSLPVPQTKWTY